MGRSGSFSEIRRRLLPTVNCITMSKQKFQADWEEIDQEYQQLQVTGVPQTNAFVIRGGSRAATCRGCH